MFRDSQLRMIHKNRQVPDRSRRLAELLPEASRQSGLERSRRLRAVVAEVSEVVDETFRRRCRIASLQGGILMIHVDDPVCVEALRREWLSLIRPRLALSAAVGHVRDIRFRFGMQGIRIAAAKNEP